MTRRARRFFAPGALALFAVIAAGCVVPLGRSAEGRDIPLFTFGSGPRTVLMIGGLHTGNEDNSRVMAEQMVAYLSANPAAVPRGATVHVVPSMNPDGTASGSHTNARGVDLNRNWPANDWHPDACHPSTGCSPGLGGPEPLSEPETRALYDFIATLRPDVTLVWHSQASVVEANEVPGAEAYARAFGDGAGYTYIDEWTAYRITGQLIDALEQRLGLRAFDVELSRCCAVDDAEFQRNVAGVRALLAAVAAPAKPARPTPTPTPKFRLRLGD